MSEKLTERVSAMLAINRQHRLRCAALVVASVAIALLTAWFFVFPASSASDSAYCGVEEHQHAAECYAANLICDVGVDSPATETHAHTDACYVTEQVLSCGFEENQEVSEFSESTADIGNISAEETDLGISGANSLKVSAIDSSEGNSSAISHVHADACYEQISALVCKLEEGNTLESTVHEHVDSCYEQILSCVIEEHTHTLSCYSNPEADVETAANWEATLPSEFSGVWSDDLVTIAESQLGYVESDENYLVTDDGKTKGYSRFGAWYGDAYGDWCAMFVSFCLSYAGVPEESFPQEANCQSWAELLSSEDYQLYYPVGEYATRAADAISAGETEYDGVPADALAYFDASEPYAPLPGDIVFFNWDSDYDSDHVGIVVELTEATENEPAKLNTIEGNASDQVKYCEYDLDDPSIMGYGMLPIKPEEAATFDDESTGNTVVSAENSLSGVQMWELGDMYYQRSWHELDGSTKVTFALVPGTAHPNDGWVPAPTEWTAATDANYEVAYCGDKRTYSAGGTGSQYATYTINESRYSEETKQRLSAIVEHVYPFITADDMRAGMKAVYGDQSWIDECDESEMLVAGQWSVWLTTNPTVDLGEPTCGSGNQMGASGLVNPLSYSSLTHKSETEGQGGNWWQNQPSDSCGCEDRIGKMKDYLRNTVTYTGPLEVTGWSTSLSSNQDEPELYDLTVTGTLNRAITPGEKSAAALTATLELPGDPAKATSSVQYASNGMSFSLMLSGLTQAEVNEVKASAHTGGNFMQAYSFDSEGYQDLVGGNWESYSRDYAADVATMTSEDGSTIRVSVSKFWESFDAGASSVQVALYASDELYDIVTLSSANDWAHSWGNLKAKDDSGEAIAYSVEEVSNINGYVSSMTEGGKQWQVVSSEDQLTDGYYVLFSASGALAYGKVNGAAASGITALEWARVSTSSAMGVPTAAIWNVQKNSSGGTYTLTNLNTGKRLYWGTISKKTGFTLGDPNNQTVKSNSAISIAKSSSDGKWTISRNGDYFRTLTTDKVGEATSSTSLALDFALYKLTDVPSSDGEAAFLVTNAKGSTQTSITVKKVDQADVTTGLRNAKFDLYEVDVFSGQTMESLGIAQKATKVAGAKTTNRNGTLTFDNVKVGKSYYLVETAAPSGYELLDEPIRFTVGGTSNNPVVVLSDESQASGFAQVSDSSESTLLVVNSRGYVLPETGGMGAGMITVLGTGLIGIFAVSLLVRLGSNRKEA